MSSIGLPVMRVDGAVAEYLVIADLMKKGHMTYKPTMDNTECDLVADVNGRLIKIQIKSSHSDGEKIRVDLTRSSAKNRYYTKDDFDILAIYDSTTNKVAYVLWRDFPYKRGATFRYTDTVFSNGFVNKHGRLFFNDYLEFPDVRELGKEYDCSKVI